MTDSPAGKIRILVAKPGLDGHDRGVKIVARALRDAGFEVVYTGLHQTPEMIANAALQEARGRRGAIHRQAGAQHPVSGGDRGDEEAKGAGDVPGVPGERIIPEEDAERLKAAGVKGVFTPGTTLEAIVQWVNENVKARG